MLPPRVPGPIRPIYMVLAVRTFLDALLRSDSLGRSVGRWPPGNCSVDKGPLSHPLSWGWTGAAAIAQLRRICIFRGFFDGAASFMKRARWEFFFAVVPPLMPSHILFRNQLATEKALLRVARFSGGLPFRLCGRVLCFCGVRSRVHSRPKCWLLITVFSAAALSHGVCRFFERFFAHGRTTTRAVGGQVVKLVRARLRGFCLDKRIPLLRRLGPGLLRLLASVVP